MARNNLNDGLMPSVLDRLIDPNSGGTKAQPGYTLEQMIAAVQRDLEELLNTRQSHEDLPVEFTELHNSVLAYGLPDLNSLNAITPRQRAQIGQLLETGIQRFEPRLCQVRAVALEAGESKDRAIRFRVTARLNVDPAPEVAFDTVLELTTGHYSVKSSGA
jgi:type VI secretion system protein ImpF